MLRQIKYLSIFYWLIGLTVHSVPSDAIKRVLYLNSYHQGHVWADSLLKGIQSVLNLKNQVELYVENFDSQRFKDSLYTKEFSGYLLTKYLHAIPDLFLASDDAAAHLLLNIRSKLGLDIPLVLCGINDKEYYTTFDNVYGVLETYPVDSTLGPLLRLFSDVMRVWVVSDSSQSSFQIRNEIAQQAIVFGGKPELRFLPIFDPDSIISLARFFKKNDAVWVINMHHYKGHSIDFTAFLQKLTESSPVPVFCNATEAIGTGIIGSRLTRGSPHGKDAALLAIALLKNPEYKPVPSFREPHMDYVFDYKSILRFGYSVRNFPSGSIILNRPLTFWSQYKKVILAGGALTIFLLTVILVLSFNITRRIRAEKIIKKQMAEIEEKSMSLANALSALEVSYNQLGITNKQLTELTVLLEQARAKAEESDHLKSLFLANISHEIRTPLNAILGFSSLLLKENKNDPRNSTLLSIIKKAGDNLLSLIDKIILVAKIESNQIKTCFQSFPIATVFKIVALEINNKFSEKEVLLVFVPSEDEKDGLELHTDKELLRIILTELLDNACRFSEGKPVRCIAKMKSENMVMFQVQDNGIGIPVEKQKFLFNRFYKIESNDQFHKGSGLGLFIVKSLIELLGGTISFHSDPGKGTFFEFVIPSMMR